jgi:PAS domain-containing protein
MQPTDHLTLPGDADLRHSSPASLQQMVALCADLSWHENADGVCTHIRSHSDKTHAVAQLLYRQKPGELSEADNADSEDWHRYQDSIAAHQPFRQIKCRVTGNQQNYYLQISGVPQFDEQQTFVGYECMAIDMSHEHQSEASLQRFRAAMDMSMDMIYLVDRDTLGFVDVNDTAARAFG